MFYNVGYMPVGETQEAEKHHPHYGVTIAAWVCVLAIIAAAYVWFAYIHPRSDAVSSSAGYILMNLSVGNGPNRPYLYDVARTSFERSPYPGLTPSSSVDGKYAVWSYGIPKTSSAGTAMAGVFLYDLNVATSTLFAASSGGVPEDPQLAPHDTAVVFTEPTATSSTSSEFYYPHTWNIYFARQDGVPQVIAHGVYPHWSPTGRSILYVADDGLHVYNIASSTDYLVWKMDSGTASIRMMLTVSKDGTKLAWTNPLHEQIVVADIRSWTPFRATEVMRIPVFAFWPVFSPDDNLLAFEQVDWSTDPGTAQPSNPRLTLFDLSSKQMVTAVNLSPFNQMGIFISDWAKAI